MKWNEWIKVSDPTVTETGPTFESNVSCSGDSSTRTQLVLAASVDYIHCLSNKNGIQYTDKKKRQHKILPSNSYLLSCVHFLEYLKLDKLTSK